MVEIERTSSIPIYKQIAVKLKKKIIKGELPNGTCLPSERRLACLLEVNRNTVIKAYKRLADEGYISSEIPGRKGHFVTFQGGEAKEPAEQADAAKSTVYSYSSSVSMCERIFSNIYSESFWPEVISFGGHIIPDEFIDMDVIQRVVDDVVRKYGVEGFSYCDHKGHPLLRKQLANSLREEGMRVSAGEILILNETTQGLEYITHLLTRENDAVVAEYPIMPDFYGLLKQHGLRVFFVDLKADGPDLAQLENLFKTINPKYFHTMPDHHAVTGSCMSMEKRKKVLELSYQYHVPVVEERWFWGLSDEGGNLPSLYALDRRKNVLMLDDLLTRFYYSAKLSILTAPKEIINRAGRNVRGIQNHLQSLEQLMLTEYLKAGCDKVQREKMCVHYRSKREKMLDCLEELTPLGVRWQDPKGGLGIWCRLPSGTNDMQLYKNLKKRNILISPGKLFFPEGTEGHAFMRLSFSNVSDEGIEKGIAGIKEEMEKRQKAGMDRQ